LPEAHKLERHSFLERKNGNFYSLGQPIIHAPEISLNSRPKIGIEHIAMHKGSVMSFPTLLPSFLLL